MDTNYVMLAVKDHTTALDPHRFEIVADFGGETYFATKAEADAALDEYSELLEESANRELRDENQRLREIAREASARLRAVSGMPNDGPKNLLDYVADIEAAMAREATKV